MNRRDFLVLASATSASVMLPDLARAKQSSIPIIDTHIHLFDTSRQQGVPWPTKKDGILYQPALPGRYRRIAEPLGIVGAIAVEASPWLEDNQWVLDVAEKDKIIVGTIGNLEPAKPGFRQQLDRFQRNPLFRGIRYGNLWDRDLTQQLSNTVFTEDLKMLAKAGLVLDTANPNPALIASVIKLTDMVPDLRVIIDHLPQITIPQEARSRKIYEADLQELGRRSQVYVKVSEVLRKVNGQIPLELNFYRERLDQLFDTFGQDRLLYGSDWPNSDQWLPVEAGLHLVRDFFTTKGQVAAEKYFWKNSVTAYGWQKREAAQPASR